MDQSLAWAHSPAETPWLGPCQPLSPLPLCLPRLLSSGRDLAWALGAARAALPKLDPSHTSAGATALPGLFLPTLHRRQRWEKAKKLHQQGSKGKKRVNVHGRRGTGSLHREFSATWVKRHFWLSFGPALMTPTGQALGPQHSQFWWPFAEGFPCSPASASFCSLAEEGTSAPHTQSETLQTKAGNAWRALGAPLCPAQTQEVELGELFQGQKRSRVRG